MYVCIYMVKDIHLVLAGIEKQSNKKAYKL